MAKIFQANQLPTRVTLWHDEANIVAGGAIALNIQSAQAFNVFASQSPAALNDTFTQSVFLRGGFYTFSVLGITASFCGIIQWSLDGVAFITGQDWYAAVTAYNQIQSGTLTISQDGYHLLQGKVTGKNASSSTYGMDLTKYWLKQATD